jgi:HPt (histidine-containing phosphotransfer) domain-containing protein
LQQGAYALEQAVRENNPVAQMESLLQVVEQALWQVIANIEQVIPPEAVPALPEGMTGQESAQAAGLSEAERLAVQPLLNTVWQQLQQFDTDAAVTLQEMALLLPGAEQQQLQQIQEALKGYDFENGQEMLHQWAQRVALAIQEEA